MSEKSSIRSRISASAWWAAFLAAYAMLAATPASTQSTATYTEYAAKFLCGVPTTSTLAAGGIENAEYSTSINIHNPNIFSSNAPIAFLKKAVVAKAEGNTLIPPSAFVQDTLPNDYAEYVSCSVIRKLLGAAAPGAPTYIEGFVVILVPPASSPNQLDVVGVYTSSNNPPVSLDIVPIAPRIIAPPPTGGTIDGRIEGRIE
jgi:hypothetical protein